MVVRDDRHQPPGRLPKPPDRQLAPPAADEHSGQDPQVSPFLGIAYLLHAYDPETGRTRRYEHAGHYTGFAEDSHWPDRVIDQLEGRGANLVRVMLQSGLALELTRIWPGVTRTFERRLKNRHSAARYCPRCLAERPQTRGSIPAGGQPGQLALDLAPPATTSAADPVRPRPVVDAKRLAEELRARVAAQATATLRRPQRAQQQGIRRAQAEQFWREHRTATGRELSAKELAARAGVSVSYAVELVRGLRAAERGEPGLTQQRAAARSRRQAPARERLAELAAGLAHLDLAAWRRGRWQQQAACRDTPTEVFFPEPGDRRALATAREVCAGCGVQAECLKLALTAARSLDEDAGVYAGTTPAERAGLRERRFPAATVYAQHRELAEGAHELAEALGSTRAAARALGVSPDGLRKAWARHGLATPPRAHDRPAVAPVPAEVQALVRARAARPRARPEQIGAFLQLNESFQRPVGATLGQQWRRARDREELETLGARVLAARFDENAQHAQHRYATVTRRARAARAHARQHATQERAQRAAEHRARRQTAARVCQRLAGGPAAPGDGRPPTRRRTERKEHDRAR